MENRSAVAGPRAGGACDHKETALGVTELFCVLIMMGTVTQIYTCVRTEHRNKSQFYRLPELFLKVRASRTLVSILQAPRWPFPSIQ